MKILFDQGTPVPLRRHLGEHVVDTLHERGWSRLENGALLDAAELDDYSLMITTDQNLKYQQNLAGRQLAILVLLSTSWPEFSAVSPTFKQPSLQFAPPITPRYRSSGGGGCCKFVAMNRMDVTQYRI